MPHHARVRQRSGKLAENIQFSSKWRLTQIMTMPSSLLARRCGIDSACCFKAWPPREYEANEVGLLPYQHSHTMGRIPSGTLLRLSNDGIFICGWYNAPMVKDPALEEMDGHDFWNARGTRGWCLALFRSEWRKLMSCG